MQSVDLKVVAGVGGLRGEAGEAAETGGRGVAGDDHGGVDKVGGGAVPRDHAVDDLEVADRGDLEF